MSEQTGPAQSEAVSEFCWRPRPSSSCRVFAVTDFGVLVGLAQDGWSQRNQDDVGKGQLVTDLGVMWNVGSRQAIGATFHFRLPSTSDYIGEALAGPAVRYRLWIKDKQSLDLGVGTAIPPLGDDYGDLRRGSVLGLVKYSPAPWIGFAIRSEVLRRTPGRIEPGKEVRPASTSRVLAGIELSDKPGLSLNTVWWGLVGLIVVGMAAGGA